MNTSTSCRSHLHDARPTRRRIAVVVAIAAVAALVWRWNSQRPDPRVVGRWQFTGQRNRLSPDEDLRRIIEFQSDGRVRTFLHDGSPIRNAVTSCWWVEGDQLVLLTSSDGILRRTWRNVLHLGRHLTGQPETWDFSRYRIQTATPHELRVTFVPHPGETGEPGDWVLTRPLD